MTSHWPPIHRYAIEHREQWNAREAIKFYHQWIEDFRCNESKGCLANWIRFLRCDPECIVRASKSADAWFVFWWYAHNYVSEHHANKPTITLEQAKELYGW